MRVKMRTHTAPGRGGGVGAKARGTTLSKGTEVGMAGWRQRKAGEATAARPLLLLEADVQRFMAKEGPAGGQRSHDGQPPGKH